MSRIATTVALTAALAALGGASAQGAGRIVELDGRGGWTRACGIAAPGGRDTCATTRQFGVAGQQQPVLTVTLYDFQGYRGQLARLTFPVGVLVDRGFALRIGRGAAMKGRFKVCFPTGCSADVSLSGATARRLAQAGRATVTAANYLHDEVAFVIPLDGLAQAQRGLAAPDAPEEE